MATPMTSEPSRYLDYLPAIFREHPEGQDKDENKYFLGRFLLAFEHVLTGRGDPNDPGLEEKLDGISAGERPLRGVERYFDPGPRAAPEQRAPKEFLQWLSGWVALALRADLNEEQQRQFIARAAQLYRLRGTKKGLEEMITIYTGLRPTIKEFATHFQVAATRLGGDARLGGGPPHFFHVLIHVTDKQEIDRHQEVTRAIIDAEKPAHTHYKLEWEAPTLQIRDHSTVGVDTLLGGPT